MKLSSPKRSSFPPISKSKKSRSWGKLFYLLIVIVAFVGMGKWGFASFYYITAPGVLTGVESKVESPIKAVVHSIPFSIGDKVEKGVPMVVLVDMELKEKIARQEGEIKRLLAEKEREQRQISILIEEQSSQLALAQSQINRNKEDLVGQIEVLRLKEESTQKKAVQLRDVFQRAKKLYQLEASPLPQFMESKLLLEDSEARLEAIIAELKAARKKLVYLEDEINMLEKRTMELPQQIKALSSLPVLTVKIKSARDQLALLKQSLQERTLRSPAVGIVNQIFQKQGEVVLPGEPLLSIISSDSVFVKAYFSQREEASLREEERVELLFDNGQQRQGVISKFYPATGPLPPQFQERYQPRRQAVIAEITCLKNNVWPLTLGMGVQVRKKRF